MGLTIVRQSWPSELLHIQNKVSESEGPHQGMNCYARLG